MVMKIQLSKAEIDRLVEFLELTATGPGMWPDDVKWWVALVKKIKGQTRRQNGSKK